MTSTAGFASLCICFEGLGLSHKYQNIDFDSDYHRNMFERNQITEADTKTKLSNTISQASHTFIYQYNLISTRYKDFSDWTT